MMGKKVSWIDALKDLEERTQKLKTELPVQYLNMADEQKAEIIKSRIREHLEAAR